MPVASAQAVIATRPTLHFENFTDAYHPEFVHRGTHDFAPSVHAEGGVQFTPMRQGDNAIVRTVPMIKADGGMMRNGWGEDAAFPAIATLAPEQRKRLTFCMIPPGMTLIFAPNAVAYQIVTAVSAEETMAANDRVTGGGWLLPRRTVELSDFAGRDLRTARNDARAVQQLAVAGLSTCAGRGSNALARVRSQPRSLGERLPDRRGKPSRAPERREHEERE